MTAGVVLGYAGASMAGMVLGMLGGGGSILILPILVYLLAIDPVTATSYSLFVVGVSAIFGVIKNRKLGTVDVKMAVLFALPALITVTITRVWLLPSIPEALFRFHGFTVTKTIVIMVFFAIIMLISALAMIRGKRTPKEPVQKPVQPLVIAVQSAVVGVITGLVGAGGGFLIIPALVMFGGMTMKRAVGTSLLIIAMNSLVGFLGNVWSADLDWRFLAIFSAFSALGVIFGVKLSAKIHQDTLRKAFGWFVLVVGVFIVVNEITRL